MNLTRLALETDLIETARTWLGTPRHDGQAVKLHGCDCVGFLIGVAKEIGYLPQDVKIPNYSQVARGESLLETLDQFLDRNEAGLIVTMEYGRVVTHVGILDAETGRIIHCDRRNGVVAVPYTPYMQLKTRVRYSLRESWFN